MSRSEAAPGAAVPAFPSSARAAASRRNGARSRGPTTPEGKARSAQNALKHGLRAQKHIVLPSENAAAFEALETALMEELAPDGALQTVLARRVVAAAWRLERAERLEAQLFAENQLAGRSLGLALIRDCNGARSFDTLLRYRGGTLAELWRALRTLKALQAEQAALVPAPAVAAPHPLPAPREMPIEPESRANPGDSSRSDDPVDHGKGDPGPVPPRPLATAGESAACVQPIEAEGREEPVKAVAAVPVCRQPRVAQGSIALKSDADDESSRMYA